MAEQPRLRAVVLAAGEGRRLRPLTSRVPKPLLPVLGLPILAHTLGDLEAVGCEAVAINLHHLGDQIEKHFGSRYRGLPLHYFREEHLLGTAGALVPMREFLAPASLVFVVNGDSYSRWPLKRVLRRYRRHRAPATLLLSRRADPRAFGGGVGIDRRGAIVSFFPDESFGEVKRRLVFAGLHLLEPRTLARLPDPPSDFIRDVYRPLVQEGETVLATATRRRWDDLGTPRRYLDGVLKAAGGDRRLSRLFGRRSWVSPGSEVARGARVRRSVVERTAVVRENAEVISSLLLPGSVVGPQARVVDCIVSYEVEIPPGAHVASRLVTRRRPGLAVPEGSSVLGGLVFTPLA